MTIDAATFLKAFFGPGNTALPDADMTHPRAAYVAPFIASLERGLRQPLILPRQWANGRTDAYVISWDSAQATSMRALIEAFVAHSIVAFDGRTTRLREEDSVDLAVISLVGAHTSYVLRPSTAAHQRALWQSLVTLREVLASRPQRDEAIPRPLGRMLAEFHAAIAAGAAASSAELLDEMAAAGGLSPLNLAYLRVHRLGRLGRDGELLRLADLDDVIASGPPRAVAEAILGAWRRYAIDDADIDNDSGVESLSAAHPSELSRMAPLLRSLSYDRPERDVLVAAAVITLVTNNRDDAVAIAATDETPIALKNALSRLADVSSTVLSTPTLPPGREEQDADEPGAVAMDVIPEAIHPVVPAPSSWSEWAQRIATDDFSWVPTSDEWVEWPPLVTEDERVATALEAIHDAGVDRAWSMVGPLLDADDLGRPAWRSARSLLLLAASYDRWAPADLAGIQALLEVFARGGPPADDYGDTLDLLGGSSNRWASISNSVATLDMVDVLARSPCSDPDARLRFALNALEPLHRHKWRLAPDLLWVAEQVARELDIALDWNVARDEPAEVAVTGSVRLLLYSLDAGALRRAVQGIEILAPEARINSSSSKVGTDQLRSHSRNADAIAIATRCAKHAATGFIRQHARSDATIREADGAGSASLLRAAVAAIEAFSS